MMPYYNYPYSYDGRDNNTGIPQMPPAPQQVQPSAMPGYPQQPNPNMVMPIQMPMQMPVQQVPMPYAMPMCPFMQPAMPMPPNAVMPIQEIMPNFVMPAEMEEMDNDNMDFAPATARPTDPPPVLSNNPAVTRITIFKELTGYPRYGNPSDNADILYTGNRGSWTFEAPAGFTGANYRAQLVIRGVLDDHYDVPENRYSATIVVNGRTVHTGRVPLNHGRPSGQRFNNWRELTFNIDLRRNNRVTITNTSNTGPNDWIGLDWMEVRLSPR